MLLANPTDVGIAAFLSSDTVQVADWLLPSVDGLQDNDESEGTTRERLVVRDIPLRLTVSVTV